MLINTNFSEISTAELTDVCLVYAQPRPCMWPSMSFEQTIPHFQKMGSLGTGHVSGLTCHMTIMIWVCQSRNEIMTLESINIYIQVYALAVDKTWPKNTNTNNLACPDNGTLLRYCINLHVGNLKAYMIGMNFQN